MRPTCPPLCHQFGMFIFRKLRSWFTRPRLDPPFVLEMQHNDLKYRFEAPTAEGVIRLMAFHKDPSLVETRSREDKRPKAHIDSIFDELLK